MNSKNSDYAKNRLDRYIFRVERGRFNGVPYEQTVDELLNRLFAYVRKENNLHLRWNKAESDFFSLITLDELENSKGSDQLLNKISEVITILAGNDQVAAQKTLDKAKAKLLEAGEFRINEVSSAQRERAKTSRAPNPLYQRVIDILAINDDLSTPEILDVLRREKSFGVVEDYDEEKFYYIDPKKPSNSPSLSMGTIRNMISKLKNGKQKFK